MMVKTVTKSGASALSILSFLYLLLSFFIVISVPKRIMLITKVSGLKSPAFMPFTMSFTVP